MLDFRLMSENRDSQSSSNGNLSGRLERLLPNCSRALELCETGTRRTLTFREWILLKYHGQLCPYCGCAEGKFRSARERMLKGQALRQDANHGSSSG